MKGPTDRVRAAPTHNLDIDSYSLADVLDLFSLSSATVSPETLRQARHKVNMMHPDKSRLSADYYIFYRKALAVLTEMHDEQSRAGEGSVAAPGPYTPDAPRPRGGGDAGADAAVAEAIAKIPTKDFAKTFNRLFDDNMRALPEKEANSWFTSEDAGSVARELGASSVAPKNMGAAIDRVRANGGGLALYRGVQTLSSLSGSGAGNFHEQSDADAYVCSDPFSSLKYDDLRRVHRDQTVFSVSERDLDRTRQFASVDAYTRSRDAEPVEAMSKADAHAFLASDDARSAAEMRERQFRSSKKSAEYAKKTGLVEAAFRLLGR